MSYFVLSHLAGTPYTRFAVLNGTVIVDVTISRPDGTEVERPASVRFRRQTVAAAPVRRRTFHNVGHEAEERSKQRAKEKTIRNLVWRRTAKEAA